MPEIRITLNIEEDGVALADMPVIRRYVTNEGVSPLSLQFPADNNTTSFHALAALSMPSLTVFFLETDQALNLNINQLTALPLNAGALILIAGCNLAQAVPSTNITVNNPSVATAANATIVGAGT